MTRATLLSLLLANCVTQREIVRYTFHPGVAVPETAEAQACARECMTLLTTGCSTDSQVLADTLEKRVEVVYAVGLYSEKLGCPGLYSDCLLTCPGAKVEGAGPRFETRRTVIDLRALEPEEPDAEYAD